MKRCYYETLSIAKGASADEIKLAYRKLAKELHPDRNPGDAQSEHRFKEVNEAYDVLKDDQKRAAYDRFGHAAFDGAAGARGAHGFSDFASSFTDIFDDLFGEITGGRRARRQNRGADLRYDLELRLEDAFGGHRAEITVPVAVACDVCAGSGAAAGHAPETCPACAGQGRVRAQQGFFTVERTCPSCRGNGKVIRHPCKLCHGAGHVQKDRTLAVDIPAGVEEGTRIRLAGEGQAGINGGPAGDLYIFIGIKQHAIFQRDGNDLYCRCPISFVTAALGGSVQVPSLEGEPLTVKIPEGTQSGRQVKLRHKGMPVMRGGGLAGDLYVELAVETPAKLSKRQKEILREFEKLSDETTHPESESWLAKAKSFFAAAGTTKY